MRRRSRCAPTTLRQIRALYWTPGGGPAPRTGVVVMHPRVDFTHHYTVPRLVAAGFGVLAACTRYVGQRHERASTRRCVLDLAACVKWLRDAGRRRSASCCSATAAGDRSRRTTRRRRSCAPGAARRATSPGGIADALRRGRAWRRPTGSCSSRRTAGRGRCCCAPSTRPSSTRPSRSRAMRRSTSTIARNGFREPPAPSTFAPDFVARVRAAQVERVRRLDAARARAARRPRRPPSPSRSAPASPSCPFHRALARPAPPRARASHGRPAHDGQPGLRRSRASMPTPQGAMREYGSLLSDRPDLMNMAAMGFARTCTPRAWLSTWSGLSSRADLVENARRHSTSRRSSCTRRATARCTSSRDVRSPLRCVAEARDKRLVRIEGARHYFEPEPGEKRDARRRAADGCSRALDPGAVGLSARDVEPSAAAWAFPPPGRAHLEHVRRINLRELAARPGASSITWSSCARVGRGAARDHHGVASRSISDTSTCRTSTRSRCPSGDELVDGFPLRTFLSDPATGEDAAPLQPSHRRPRAASAGRGCTGPAACGRPYEPFDFPPGMRRARTLASSSARPCPRRRVRDRSGASRRARRGREGLRREPPPPMVLGTSLRERAPPARDESDGRDARARGAARARSLRSARRLGRRPRGAADDAATPRATSIGSRRQGATLDAGGIVARARLRVGRARPRSSAAAPGMQRPFRAFAPYEDGHARLAAVSARRASRSTSATPVQP